MKLVGGGVEMDPSVTTVHFGPIRPSLLHTPFGRPRSAGTQSARARRTKVGRWRYEHFQDFM